MEEAKQLLLEKGLTPEEAKQAISLAMNRNEIRLCFPSIGEIHGDQCYELLTERDREIDKWIVEEFPKEV